jgi:hypothetical protein
MLLLTKGRAAVVSLVHVDQGICGGSAHARVFVFELVEQHRRKRFGRAVEVLSQALRHNDVLSMTKHCSNSYRKDCRPNSYSTQTAGKQPLQVFVSDNRTLARAPTQEMASATHTTLLSLVMTTFSRRSTSPYSPGARCGAAADKICQASGIASWWRV